MTPTNRHSLTGVPAIGVATLAGGLAGAVVVAAGVALALVLAGAGLSSVGAGAHVGFFGGMGFGGMIGAVVQAAKFDGDDLPVRQES